MPLLYLLREGDLLSSRCSVTTALNFGLNPGSITRSPILRPRLRISLLLALI